MLAPRLRRGDLPVLRSVPTSAPVLARAEPYAGGPGGVGAYERIPLRALRSQTRLWAEVRRELPRVDQPLLVYTSARDHVVDPSSLELVTSRVRSADRTFVTLTRSYHVATLDHEAADIFGGSVAFFRRLSDSRPSATGTGAKG